MVGSGERAPVVVRDVANGLGPLDGVSVREDLDALPRVDLAFDPADGAGAGPRVLDAGTAAAPDRAEVVDGRGLVALPGFTDLYGRLREPGPSRRGTLASECRAALGAGFTTVVCAPDTEPAIDSTATVELVLRHAAAAGAARVLPIAALTVGLEGVRMSELATLQEAGCVAAGQADRPLADTRLLSDAMKYAASFDLPLIMTARDARLGIGGCAHAGATALRLGLTGIPVAAETIALATLLELARDSGARLHVSRISSARGLHLIELAKAEGLPITCDVGIHHLYFTDEDIDGFDVRYRSAVPFRSVEDRTALREGVASGLIDAICSDHAPLDTDASLAPFPQAEAGLSAYDRFLPLLLGLGEVGVSLGRALRGLTAGPDWLTASVARRSDVLLVRTGGDPNGREWASVGENSPLRVAGDGTVSLRGTMDAVVRGGRLDRTGPGR